MGPWLVTALRWAYRRLGRHYPRVFLVLELQTVYPVILGTYALFSFYYDGSTGEFFTLFGITCGLAAIAIVVACFRTFPMLRPLEPGSRRSRRALDDRGMGRGDQLPLADDPLERLRARHHRADPVGGRLRRACSTSAGRRSSRSSPVPPSPSPTRRCSTTSRSRSASARSWSTSTSRSRRERTRTSRRSRFAGACS